MYLIIEFDEHGMLTPRDLSECFPTYQIMFADIYHVSGNTISPVRIDGEYVERAPLTHAPCPCWDLDSP